MRDSRLRSANWPSSATTADRVRGARFAFLDKDGTLVHDVPYNFVPARSRAAPPRSQSCVTPDFGSR